MEPISFSEQTIVLSRDPSQYRSLPALKIKGHRGATICCWKATWWERLKVLMTGKVWISILTFNKPIMPTFLFADESEIASIRAEEAEIDEFYKLLLINQRSELKEEPLFPYEHACTRCGSKFYTNVAGVADICPMCY